MGRAAVGLGFALFLSLASSSQAQEHRNGSGPLATRTQQPLQLLFLGFDADRAGVLPKGKGAVRLSLSQTSILLQKSNGPIDATLDMEVTRIAFHFNYGLGHNLELGLELPFYFVSGGFLDKPIRAVERAVGKEAKLRRNREEFPDNNVRFDVRKDGTLLFERNDDVFSPGDLVLRGKGRILKEGRYLPALTGRVGVKLPTGDADRAFGSGEPDFGLGLILEKNIGRFTFYLNGNAIFPLKPGRFAGLSFGPFLSGAVATAYRLSPRFSLIVQLDGTTRPLSGTGNKIFDQDLVEVVAGLNIGLRRDLFWQVGAMQDIFQSPGADADFTIFTNLSYRF